MKEVFVWKGFEKEPKYTLLMGINNARYFEKQKQYYENLVKTCDSKMAIEKNRNIKK